jgi:hypothetical protein
LQDWAAGGAGQSCCACCGGGIAGSGYGARLRKLGSSIGDMGSGTRKDVGGALHCLRSPSPHAFLVLSIAFSALASSDSGTSLISTRDNSGSVMP